MAEAPEPVNSGEDDPTVGRLHGIDAEAFPDALEREVEIDPQDVEGFVISSAADDPPALVECDISCRKCSYNLRGLSSVARCPECGTLIAISLQGDFLRFSDPRWLRSLRRGCNLMFVGVLALSAIFLLMVGITVAGIAQRGIYTLPAEVAIGIRGLVLLAYALYLIGIWSLTARDPGGLGEDRYGLSRRVSRAGVFVGILSTGLRYLQSIDLFAGQSRYLLFFATGAAFSGLWVIGLAALFRYLSQLAMRLPDRRSAGTARLLMYALPSCIGLALVVGFTGASGIVPANLAAAVLVCPALLLFFAMTVFWGTYVVFLGRLGSRLNQQVLFSSRLWRDEAAPAEAGGPAATA